jgi:hypothetical protein
MQTPSIYFVGTHAEVAHHAASLKKRMPVQIVEPESVVGVAKPGDLAIFFSEHFDRFRNACQQLKQNHVATLYLIDGILEWRNAWENRPDEPACPYAMRPVLSHKAACIGASQARVLDGWGNTGRTEIVGIPRLDAIRESSDSRTRSNDNGVFRVLVMTAKTPGFKDEQMARVKQSLDDLRAWFQANPRVDQRNVEVVWRLTAGLEAEIGVENQLSDLSGRELGEVLANVDAVVSTHSTAMLEAMLVGLPVAALDYHNCPIYLQTAWSIRSAESIGVVLEQLARPPESKMHFQRGQLHDALLNSGVGGRVGEAENGSGERLAATDRLEKLIQEMLRLAAEQIKSSNGGSEPLSFPLQILSVPDSPHENEFDHALIYPNAIEFENNDLQISQAELSHARREIEHLHREKDQLQSELDQAHEIFEQIHRHPIAGPIVRLRQSIVDWLGRFKTRRQRVGAEPGTVDKLPDDSKIAQKNPSSSLSGS